VSTDTRDSRFPHRGWTQRTTSRSSNSSSGSRSSDIEDALEAGRPHLSGMSHILPTLLRIISVVAPMTARVWTFLSRLSLSSSEHEAGCVSLA